MDNVNIKGQNEINKSSSEEGTIYLYLEYCLVEEALVMRPCRNLDRVVYDSCLVEIGTCAGFSDSGSTVFRCSGLFYMYGTWTD